MSNNTVSVPEEVLAAARASAQVIDLAGRLAAVPSPDDTRPGADLRRFMINQGYAHLSLAAAALRVTGIMLTGESSSDTTGADKYDRYMTGPFEAYKDLPMAFAGHLDVHVDNSPDDSRTDHYTMFRIHAPESPLHGLGMIATHPVTWIPVEQRTDGPVYGSTSILDGVGAAELLDTMAFADRVGS